MRKFSSYGQIQKEQFDVVIITLESAKEHTDEKAVLSIFLYELNAFLGQELPAITSWKASPRPRAMDSA